MEFGEALSIVLALAIAHRPVAETGKVVTEAKLDEAIAMVEARVNVLSTMGNKPLPKK